jgi:hypothetical protein
VSKIEAKALREWHRPVWLGLSVGHPSGTVGSIGPFITFSDGAPGFLSLAFAIAPKGAKVHDYIHQPGPRDVDDVVTGRTRLAELVAIASARPQRESDTDCAVARFLDVRDGGRNVIPTGFPDGGQRIDGCLQPDAVKPGDLVAFIGRTSGFSEGEVKTVLYSDLELLDNAIEYRFRICIEVLGISGPFCRPGDGGALVFRRKDCKAVGLILAGSGPEDGPESGYVLPLQPALAAVKVQFSS